MQVTLEKALLMSLNSILQHNETICKMLNICMTEDLCFCFKLLLHIKHKKIIISFTFFFFVLRRTFLNQNSWDLKTFVFVYFFIVNSIQLSQRQLLTYFSFFTMIITDLGSECPSQRSSRQIVSFHHFKWLWMKLKFCYLTLLFSVKPTLKKVSKYENKFAKLQKKAAEFNFRNQLKVVKKKEFTLEEEDKEVCRVKSQIAKCSNHFKLV